MGLGGLPGATGVEVGVEVWVVDEGLVARGAWIGHLLGPDYPALDSKTDCGFGEAGEA